MKRLAQVVVVALASLLAAGAAWAGESPLSGYSQCQSVGQPGTKYFSGIWQSQGEQPGLEAAFAQMLFSQYGFTGGVSCSLAYSSGTTRAKLEADEKGYADQLRKAGVGVTETGWTYSSAVRLVYFCYGAMSVPEGGNPKPYFYRTGLVEASGADQGKLVKAWHDHLQSLHPGVLVALSECTLPPGDPAKRQPWLDSFDQQWKGRAQIVPDDWKFSG